MKEVFRHWQRWYHLKRWERRSKLQLKQHPLCCMCLGSSKVEPAIIADHVVPHRGDWFRFMHGELQSLCAMHHSGDKATMERGGTPKNYIDDIGDDGWPVDKKHPAYRAIVDGKRI